jgi:hypothetical protein
MADLTGTLVAVGSTHVGANHAVAKSGNGLGGKTYILTVGVGGGAISQAQLNGIVRGIQQGASLQTAATKVDAFTVSSIGAFTAASSTSVVISVQGTGTPSVVTGDYFAAATVAITATFDQTPA